MVTARLNTVLIVTALASFPLAATARVQSDTQVTPDVLLAHIAKNAPETPSHPRLLWLDKGRRILFGITTEQAQAGAGGGQYADYVPLSYLQRTVDIQTGRTADIGKGYDPAVAAEADVVAYFPEGSRGHRLRIARLDEATQCEITDTALMPDATGIQTVALTKDGAQIAVAIGFGGPGFTPLSEPPKAAAVEGAAVRVLDGTAAQASGHYVALWVLDGQCRNARRIADASETRIGRLVWVDKDRKVVAATATTLPGKNFPQSDLQIFDVAGRSRRVLTPDIGGQGAAFLQAAPEGAPYVAFTYDPEGFGYQLRKQLAVASLEDGRIRLVSADPRENPRWLDARTLLVDVSGAHPLTRRAVALDLEGRERSLASLPANAVPSPDGRHLAWMEIDLYGAATLSVAEMEHRRGDWVAGERRALWQAQSPLGAYARAERRFVNCESTDGIRPEAILVLPIDYAGGTRYPLIVDLHGGPRGGLAGGSHGAYTAGTVLSQTTLEHDMWAAKGYAVLVADYRASGMYGFDKVSRTGNAFAQDFDDIMCNIDAAIREGIADPERLAAIGHSYGGYEVNWIVTHSHRFKAAISKEGPFVDKMVAWGASGRTNQLDTTLYGSPLEHPDVYHRMSPINFTRGVTTPTMFVSHRGGKTPGDLYGWMYAAWQEQGVDAQYRIYDDPNHVLVGEADQRDQLLAAVAWFDRYLKDTPPNAPPEP